MTAARQRAAAKRFAADWKGKGYAFPVGDSLLCGFDIVFQAEVAEMQLSWQKDKTILTSTHVMRIITLQGNNMKRRDYIKKFTDNGWWLLRQGGSHDIYTDGHDIEPIPRHKEIKESLAKAVFKRRGFK